VGPAGRGVVSSTQGAGGLLSCGTVRVSPAEGSTEARGRQSNRDPDSRAERGAGPRPAGLLLSRGICGRTGEPGRAGDQRVTRVAFWCEPVNTGSLPAPVSACECTITACTRQHCCTALMYTVAIRRWTHSPALKMHALFIVLAELNHSHTVLWLTLLARNSHKPVCGWRFPGHTPNHGPGFTAGPSCHFTLRPGNAWQTTAFKPLNTQPKDFIQSTLHQTSYTMTPISPGTASVHE
jgi:hypothetical protein